MRFLIVNDDGIGSEGIRRLAAAALNMGEVWVIAPSTQRSAGSQSITIGRPFEVCAYDFPLDGVHAFAVDGTPADCVRMGIDHLMPAFPDYVLSGVNDGLNTGYDCSYSATIGGAFEALMHGIPSIAFSTEYDKPHEVEDAYMLDLLKELMDRPAPKNALWNINFPGCSMSEFKGVLYDRTVADAPVFEDHYFVEEETENGVMLKAYGKLVPTDTLPQDSDAYAVRLGHISVGPVYLITAR